MASLDIAALKAAVLAAFKKGNKTMLERLEDIIDSSYNRTDDAGGGGGLTLGETNVTAYRGDRGKTAYDHSQAAHETPGAAAAAEAASNSYTDTEIAVLDAAIALLLAAKADALGSDDNYVTDAEKVKLGNLSGTNSGDQDLSGLVVKANNLSDIANPGTARTNLGANTVGANIFTLANPGAVVFIRINADNTITVRTAAQLLSDIGAQAAGSYATGSGSANGVNTGDQDLSGLVVKANNLSDLTNAATARGNLGGTTIGQALFLLANPGAITFIRINADNSVTARSAANFLADLGATTVGAALLALANPGAIRFLRINADNSVTARTAAEMVSDLAAIVQTITNGNTTTAPSEDAVFDALANKGTANSAEFSQVVSAGTAYYITGSAINIPVTTLQVGASFTWRFWMSKTAAGTGNFQIRIYRGTNGTTGDTADVTQTIGAQTAIVDSMYVDVTISITTLAAGAADAYFWTICPMNKAATATGFGVATGTTGLFSGTVSSVELATASLKFGIGFICQTGTPTVRVVQIRKNS